MPKITAPRVSGEVMRVPAMSHADPAPSIPRLRSHQLRILQVLGTEDALGRNGICTRIGWSATSGTFTNAMNGVKEGSSTGGAHPGLVRLGLVEKVELDIDGLVELVYRITEQGREALRLHGDELPDMRDKTISTNKRYRG